MRSRTPWSPCRPAHTAPISAPSGPASGVGSGLDDRDLQAEGAGAGGDLGADEAGPDDHQPPAGPEGGAQGDRVVEGAQRVHVRPGRRRRAAAAARAPVATITPSARISSPSSSTMRRLAGSSRAAGVPSRHRTSRSSSGSASARSATEQAPVRNVLRQGRTVVRPVPLGADDHDLAGEGLPAQGARGIEARNCGADDRDPEHVTAPIVSLCNTKQILRYATACPLVGRSSRGRRWIIVAP